MPWNRSRPAGSTRGYGTEHAKARKALAALHDPTNPCCRCGRPLGPMGPWLHLDHNRTRDGYLGFAHGSCNRKAGAREGRARQDASRLRW
jgi:hypothetical protein